MQREGALKLKRRGGVVEYGEEDNTVDIGVAAPTVKGVLRYERAYERRQQKEKEREREREGKRNSGGFTALVPERKRHAKSRKMQSKSFFLSLYV